MGDALPAVNEMPLLLHPTPCVSEKHSTDDDYHFRPLTLKILAFWHSEKLKNGYPYKSARVSKDTVPGLNRGFFIYIKLLAGSNNPTSS